MFTLTAAVSLLLCIAVCVLWVRSYAVNEIVYRALRHPDGRDVFEVRGVASRPGKLIISRERITATTAVPGYGVADSRANADLHLRTWGATGPGWTTADAVYTYARGVSPLDPSQLSPGLTLARVPAVGI